MVKYNLYFTSIHLDFEEVYPLLESFISTYYEERSFTVWANGLIMNNNPISYNEYLDQQPKEVDISNDEIKKKNENILKSFKKEV